MSVLAVLLALTLQAHAEAARYAYRGAFGEGSYTAAEIGAFLRAKPNADHQVLLPGAADWTPASRVPDIAQAWLVDPVTGAEAVGLPASAPPAAVAPAGEPPVEVSSPPAVAPAPASTEPPAASDTEPGAPASAPGLRPLGEVWAGLGIATEGGDTPITPRLRRLAAGLALEGPSFGGRLYLRFDQAASARVHLEDAWVGYAGRGEVGGFARLGFARPSFAAMATFEEERRFWVAGASADLERSAGWLPDSSLGVSGGLRTRHLTVGAEVADAAEERGTIASAANFDAVEARLRLTGALGGAGEAAPLHLGASVAYRVAGTAEVDPRLLAAVHVEWNTSRFHLFAEGLGGMEGEGGAQLPLLGGLVSAAADVPFGGAPVERLSFVLGAAGWDPTITGLPDEEDEPDAVYEGRAGVNVAWAAPGASLITGLGYRLSVPQDLAVPISHGLLLEAAWRY